MSRSRSDLTTRDRPSKDHPSKDHPSREFLLAALVLAALLAVFFNPIVRRDATFSTVQNTMQFVDPWQAEEPDAAELYVQTDQAQGVYPGQVFLKRSLERDGQFPLWNPLTFAGHPYLGSSGSRLAYPPAVVLTRLLSPSWAHDVYVMLHLFVAGLAMFALMKEFGTRFAGALLAAVSWAFASYTMAWIQLELFGAVAALLPLVVLCIRRWHVRRSWRPLAVGSVVLGALYLGVTAELALMSFLLAFGYASALALRRMIGEWGTLPPRSRLALLLAPGWFVAAALAVAAVGLLPFLELAGRMARSPLTYQELLERRGVLTAEPGNFIGTFRAPRTPLDFEGVLAGQVFVGTVTALLALGAVFLRRPGTALGRTVAVVVALFALGTPVTWLGYHLVPGLSSLYGPGRSLFLWDFALALLGGIGLDAALGRVRRATMSRRARAWPPWLSRETVRGALVGGLAAACILVTAVQLLSYGRRANPPFQRREVAHLYPSTPAIDAVRVAVGDEAGQGRVLPVNTETRRHQREGTLPGASGMSLGLNVAGGYVAALPEDNSVLWRVVAGEDPDDAYAHPHRGAVNTIYYPETRTELLGRIGVSAVLGPAAMTYEPGWSAEEAAGRGLRLAYAGTDGTVYEVEDAAPRAFVVGNAISVDSSREAIDRFIDDDFDVRRDVVLEDGPAGSSGHPTAPVAEVRWLADRANDVRLRVTTDEPGWLVLLDAWDPGWHATVDGEATDIERADFIFRAVRIPAGTSEVTFTYRPTPVVAGAVISIVATTAIVAVVAVPPVLRWRRRRKDDRASV